MGWLINNPRAFWLRLARAVVAMALSLPCSAALADETVQVCGSSYANNIFTAGSAPGIVAAAGCPTPGATGGLELFSAGEPTGGEAGRWQTVAPAGLELVGATANGVATQGVNAGLDFGGGFYWAGGGTLVNTFTPSDVGMVFASPSNYFGMQLICGKSICKSTADFRVPAFSLYVRETAAPSFATPTGLWQGSGWVRGVWPFFVWGNSPSGLCWLSASLDGQLIDTTTSAHDVSSWHQCAAPPINQPLDTSRYGQGVLPLTLSSSDAAGVPASVSKTIYVDNSIPTISLSGPTDAPSTAGTEYVTATAGGSPSGISQISCTTDNGPAQLFSGSSAQVPVSGVGQHTVRCSAANNAVDPGGNHGWSTPSSQTVKIGYPTQLWISFSKLVGLRCHRTVVRRRGHLVKTMSCHRRTTRRRTIVWVTVRRHGRLAKVKRVRFVRVVVAPRVVRGSSRRVAFGRSTRVSGWLGTAGGAALAGMPVQVLVAPDDGSNRFTHGATVTTSANGTWTAPLPAGPSRLIEAVYGGSGTTEPAASADARVAVPARVRLRVVPRRVAWGSRISISGRILGGFIPANQRAVSQLLRLRIGVQGISQTAGIPDVARDGRFHTTYCFSSGRGIASFWFSVSTLNETNYPFEPSGSKRAGVTVGPRNTARQC